MKRATFVLLLTSGLILFLFAGARASALFEGRVVRVDGNSGTFSVRGRGATVTFDATRPIFVGYRALSDVHVGDAVTVAYIPDGISVKRQGMGRQETARQMRGGWAKGPHNLLKKLHMGVFEEADANKDGKITPVELSTVMPDLTLDEFRAWDTNSDGYLSRAEFSQALRQPRTAKAK